MKRVRLIVSTALGSALLLAISATAHEPATAAASPSMQLEQAMAPGPKMHMTGDVDHDFAMMMIEHHKQALKMADIELAHGSNATLKAMAAKMRMDQATEIKRLEQFK